MSQNNILVDQHLLNFSAGIIVLANHGLVLDEEILREATRLSGEKTYSGAVMRALEDFVRRAKARRILELRGSGLWEGDLREMRGDRRGRKKAS